MSRTILIVDDTDQDIKLIKKLLSDKNMDFSILIAESGLEAMEIAKKENPDIILLDTLMPGINGWQTCAELKKIPEVTSKIILMTGTLNAVNEEKAEESGADGSCIKFADAIYAALLQQIS